MIMFAKYIIQYTKRNAEKIQIVILKQWDPPYMARQKLEDSPCL